MTTYATEYRKSNPHIWAWNNMNSRVKGYGRNAKTTYAGIEVRITKAEFYEWYKANWFPGCSVDRIDSDGHYELSNLQMVTRSENSSRTRNNRYKDAPEGTSWCGRCRDYLPIESFGKSSISPTGLRDRCRECRKKEV